MQEKPVVYTMPTWPYCDKVKEFLSQQGLEYIEVDVSSDPQARKDFMAKGYRGVPVTEIGGEVVIGFDVKRLEDAVSSP